MLNPFKTHLTILQQEGYSIIRTFKWWVKHPFSFSISAKKPLVYTQKARLLISLGFLSFLVLFLAFLSYKLYLFALVGLFLLFYAPLFYYFLALLLLFPYEKWNRRRTKNIVRSTLRQHPRLKTIGITGSFGKTSVKDFLYSILDNYQSTVKTPDSYNTVFGIARVVQMEIISRTRFFLCEMGAYTRGEIAEICSMTNPEYAILTAIGTQHLERFKNLSNTTLAKFELIDAVKPQNALANIDNSLIREHLLLQKYRLVKTYSLSDPKADFFVNRYRLSSTGIDFDLRYRKHTLKLTSPLFGTSNLYNLVAAASMSLMLDVPENIINKSISSLSPSPHRLEIKKFGSATLIDNAFSSNQDGFSLIINDLQKLKGKKVLITPGIIELGSQTAKIHQDLGQQASQVFDKFILVGHSDRTKNLALGIRRPQAISYVDNAANLWPLIERLASEYDWILLENDLPDNY